MCHFFFAVAYDDFYVMFYQMDFFFHFKSYQNEAAFLSRQMAYCEKSVINRFIEDLLCARYFIKNDK